MSANRRDQLCICVWVCGRDPARITVWTRLSCCVLYLYMWHVSIDPVRRPDRCPSRGSTDEALFPSVLWCTRCMQKRYVYVTRVRSRCVFLCPDCAARQLWWPFSRTPQNDWLIAWLMDCYNSWWFDRLIDWLMNELIDWLNSTFHSRMQWRLTSENHGFTMLAKSTVYWLIFYY